MKTIGLDVFKGLVEELEIWDRTQRGLWVIKTQNRAGKVKIWGLIEGTLGQVENWAKWQGINKPRFERVEEVIECPVLRRNV